MKGIDNLPIYRVHKPLTNVPSCKGNILLCPLHLHIHNRVPTKPTIYKKIFEETQKMLTSKSL